MATALRRAGGKAEAHRRETSAPVTRSGSLYIMGLAHVDDSPVSFPPA